MVLTTPPTAPRMPPAEDEIEKIRGAVLDKVRPDAEDERKVKLAAEKLSEGIVKAAAARGVKCIPMLVGSVARGTWNRNPDLDIFILFPPDVSRGDLEKRGLELARAVMPDGEEKYAEHPYLNGVVDGLDIDIVPCYEIRDPSQRMTAVDRTPFHTEYMRTHLPPTMRDEVRTLKQFRGLMAPPGIGPEVARGYVRLLERTREMQQWKDYLKRTALSDHWLTGSELAAFYASEEKVYERLDNQMGLRKKKKK